MNFFKNHSPFIIAGPCSAESETQVLSIAEQLKNSAVNMIRAGIWKPRTKPGHFEGIGERALQWLKDVKEITQKPVCIEVASKEQAELALKYNIDCVWIGARSTVSPFIVQEIIDAVKNTGLYLMIKNPINTDIELWHGAMERALNAGIENLAAIHRGFSSYDNTSKYRNKPNWAIPLELKRRLPDIPIFCDPSHITGNRELVQMVAQRAMDLKFDGLMIETHNSPTQALSDAAQQITPENLNTILKNLIQKQEDTNNQNAHDNIEEIRAIIDNLDAEVVDLIAQRMEVVKKLAQIKKENNISVHQPERWKSIIENRTKQGLQNELSEKFILQLFQSIHDFSINTQFNILKSNK